jgi:hypothetical protein
VLAGCGGERLSTTGLYADIGAGVVANGVRAFRPAYELWADGATKRRWLWLPPGTRIDSANMDGWKFPVGTKVWKEFTRDGVRVETRLLQKNGPRRSDWTLAAYAWNREQTDAFAVPDGVKNALGTPHDVPEKKVCRECHDGAVDVLIGVSAVQLDHALGDLTLATLVAENLLSVPPVAPFTVPGDDVERAALGYLHANCGHCHNDHASGAAGLHFQLDLPVAKLGAVEDTPAYKSAVGAPTRAPMPLPGTAASQIVVPGDPEASLLYIRMLRRAPDEGQMPTVASKVVDAVGSDEIASWIRALKP